MSERGQQLYQALKDLNRQQINVYAGIVERVNKNTIDINIDGLTYEGVQLQSNTSNGKGILFIPSVDSVVLVQRIMNSNDFYVALYSDVDEVVMETGKSKVLINDGGIGIFAGGENMLNVFVDFIDACINERHLTKSGPTVSVSAESKARYEGIKNRLKKLLQNA
jgi:hypothetical protein